MQNKTTQKNSILNHLQTYGEITPLKALNKYGCFRLSARIYDLRKQGYDIVTEERKPYAVYRLK